jgi:hypothetical protein
MAGPGQFVLEQQVDDKNQQYGALRADGGMGLFWYSTKSFKNFILRVDWKMSRHDDNSGVFVRFPTPGNDPWVAVNQGYEIQIDDYGRDNTGQPGNPLALTGAVYSFAPPRRLASQLVGVWNTFEIRAEAQNYVVTLNGETVTDFTGSRTLQGHIGVQNHTGAVFYRNIRIKELAG